MSVLETILPSPPESGSKRFMSESHLLHFTNVREQMLHTPSAIESSNDKHVEFQSWTTNILDAFTSTPESNITPTLKTLPPSRECQITGRPILKPYQSTDSALGYDGQQDIPSTIMTMDSLLQQLTHGDRSSSTDAYQTMTNLIKVYDEPPEDAALKAKMTQLQKHIQRDLIVLDHVPDDLPSEQRLPLQNLVMSALKVLVTMVWSSSYSSYLTEDFRIWSIERTIKVLEQRSVQKACLLHYVHLLATQNFRPLIMTSNGRALRLLEILDQLPQHVSGKAVISERLLVYQRLIDQARLVMQKSANLWAKNIVTAMAHSFKEIRINAISVATRVCTAFPASDKVASATREALAEVTGERTLSVSITNRLEKMIAAKDEASQIPQIWAAVLLMCHDRQTSIEQWPGLADWLRVIQRCFNCSDMNVRLHAFYAWNRFIHIVRPLTASDKMLSMLAKPIFAQLGRTAASQSGKGSRQGATSSLYMLLYYSFRPAATPKQYSRMWNEIIVRNVTSAFVSKSSANCDVVCRALTELFHQSDRSQKLWTENRANNNSILEPTELPTIDAKWIRAHAGPVLDLFELLVAHSSFGANDKISDQACIVQAWRSFLHAIRDTCMNEVVPSADSKNAMTLLSRFLDKTREDNHRFLSKEQVQARLDLLSIVTNAELLPGTIFSRLNITPTDQPSRLALYAIMHLLRLKYSGNELNSHDTKLLKRLGTALDEQLVNVQGEKPQTSRLVDLVSVADSLASVLRNEPPALTLELLHLLQVGSAKLIREYGGGQLVSLSRAVAHVLTSADVSVLKSHDLLFTTALQAGSASTSILLDGWAKGDWPIKPSGCGPHMQAWLEQNENDLLAALPQLLLPSGSSTLAKGKKPYRSPTRGTALLDTSIQMAGDSASVVSRSTRSTPRSQAKQDEPQKRFAPTQCPPTNPQDREPQIPTDHQNEPRHRQQSEPAMSFTDIRSSPSTRKSRARLTDVDVDQANTITSPPVTPTINRAVEEHEQPPTPTPRARNSRVREIQPDVPSSPPSVEEASALAEPYPVITSSPMRNPPQLDEPIDLGDAVENGAFRYPLDPAVEADTVETPIFRVSTASNEDSDVRRLNAPRVSVQADQTLTQETTLDANSVSASGDEFDAMAASQLSQDLEQLSQVQSARNDVEHGSLRKRKRDASRHVGDRKKRRSFDLEDDSDNARSAADIDDNAHVPVQQVASSKRKAVSQTSDAIAEKGSTTKQGSRRGRPPKITGAKGGRPRKGWSHLVSVTDIDAEVDTVSPQEFTPSTDPHLGQNEGTTEPAQADPQTKDVVSVHQALVAPPLESPEIAATSSNEHSSPVLPCDIQASLQAVLDRLTSGDTADMVLDLSAVQNLCFQIGLKATDLVRRQA